MDLDIEMYMDLCLSVSVCMYVGMFVYLLQEPFHRNSSATISIMNRSLGTVLARKWACFLANTGNGLENWVSCGKARGGRKRLFRLFCTSVVTLTPLSSCFSCRKLQVSFAEYHLFYWSLLRKRPIISCFLHLPLLVSCWKAFLVNCGKGGEARGGRWRKQDFSDQNDRLGWFHKNGSFCTSVVTLTAPSITSDFWNDTSHGVCLLLCDRDRVKKRERACAWALSMRLSRSLWLSAIIRHARFMRVTHES